MKRNRKYWKTSAKAALRGNWIIAIAGMLAYMAVNFLGNVLSLELFPGNSMLEIAAGQIFVICCVADRDGIRYRIQLYDVEYEQRQGVQPWKSSVYVS